MSIRLFVKPGCPWCEEAIDWLEDNNVQYEVLDVIQDPEARHEMRELTGQSKAPSIDVDGEIFSDFGAEELEAWWTEKGYKRG